MLKSTILHILKKNIINSNVVITVLTALLAVTGAAQMPDKKETSPAVCWQFKPGNASYRLFASDNLEALSNGKITNEIYISSQDFNFYKLNLREKNELWKTNLGGKILGNPLFFNGTIVMIIERISEESSTTGPTPRYWMRALSEDTGLTIWQNELVSRPFVSKSSQELVSVLDAGRLSFIQVQTGNIIKKEDRTGVVSSSGIQHSLSNGNGNALTGGFPRELLFVEKILARESKSSLLHGQITASEMSSEYLFIGFDSGKLYAFDLETKTLLWSLQTGGRINNLRIYEKGLLVSSFDNYLYNYSLQSGRLIWKKRVEGRLLDLPAYVTKYLAVSGIASDYAEVLDIEKGKVVNRLTLEANSTIVGPVLSTDDYFVVPAADKISVFGFNGCAGN